jgi:hypothetical protein
VIQYLGCEVVSEKLQALIDGELPVHDQVAVGEHLRWCTVCAARAKDLQAIGAALRLVSGAIHDASLDDAITSMSSSVVARVGAEREQSCWQRMRRMVGDTRLLWPAVGGSLALAACLSGAAAVWALTQVEQPDSLAGMIERLANPGSDQNPVVFDGARATFPRALSDAALASLPGDDAVITLSAVVTKEGLVSNYEVLLSERPTERRRDMAVGSRDVVLVNDTVKRSRFTPALDGAGDPVAVNVVWVLARTTVHGQQPSRPVAQPAVQAPVPDVKPAVTAPDVVVEPTAETPSTTA